MPGMGTVVVCSLAVGYVCGSFLTAELVSKHVSGKSAFDVGMGNPGMANMGATYGTGWAAVTLAGDIAKTILAFVLARSLFPATADVAGTAAAVGATLGHVFPAWHRFHGGKGVATTCAGIILVAPVAGWHCGDDRPSRGALWRLPLPGRSCHTGGVAGHRARLPGHGAHNCRSVACGRCRLVPRRASGRHQDRRDTPCVDKQEVPLVVVQKSSLKPSRRPREPSSADVRGVCRRTFGSYRSPATPAHTQPHIVRPRTSARASRGGKQ